MTIMSETCAERLKYSSFLILSFVSLYLTLSHSLSRLLVFLSISRLIDRRFQGIARGVGTGTIIGKIHALDVQVRSVLSSSTLNCLSIVLSLCLSLSLSVCTLGRSEMHTSQHPSLSSQIKTSISSSASTTSNVIVFVSTHSLSLCTCLSLYIYLFVCLLPLSGGYQLRQKHHPDW